MSVDEFQDPAAQDRELSGHLWFDRHGLHYASKIYSTWDMALGDLKIVGEYTNQAGPALDDWFLVFGTKAKSDWREASVYAAGRNTFLAALGEALGEKLQCGLYASADFNSRVLWPPHMKGLPLFEWRQVPFKGIWDWIRHFGIHNVAGVPSPDVRKSLG